MTERRAVEFRYAFDGCRPDTGSYRMRVGNTRAPWETEGGTSMLSLLSRFRPDPDHLD